MRNAIAYLLCWVLSAWAIFDARTPRHAAQGPLGVTLDYGLATTWPAPFPPPGQNQVRRNFVFSSHLVLNGPVSNLRDGQLWKIAYDAYYEVVADMAQYGISRSGKFTPAAMTILAWGNEIILATSQKGNTGSFTYDGPDTPVKRSLELCQVAWREMGHPDQQHRTQGKCGEQMAAHLYYLLNPPGKSLAVERAVVGTWVGKDAKPTVEPVKTDPCMDIERDLWGCALFVTDQKLRVLDKNIERDYDLQAAVGGVQTIDQIQLCGALRTGDT